MYYVILLLIAKIQQLSTVDTTDFMIFGKLIKNLIFAK